VGGEGGDGDDAGGGAAAGGGLQNSCRRVAWRLG
jgi:hypothetical protein